MSKSNVVKKLEMINILAGIKRYSRDFLIRAEPLISHIGFCAVYAIFIANELKLRYPELRDKIDIGKLVTKATLHDLDEISTGDIVRNVKHHSPEAVEMFKDLEEKGMRYIDSYLGSDKEVNLYDEWDKAKDSHCIEGVLVKIVDFMAVVYKVWDEYYLLSNRQFSRVTNELLNTLENYSFDKLCKNLPDDVRPQMEEYCKELTTDCIDIMHDAVNGDTHDLRVNFDFLQICNDSKAV